ncbi:MAG: hypothetical protein Q8P38_12585, partial [Candidatus Nanopelagicales bacterium]|nr:hypothetical protein [Candidatus Nanopelagicales bacterium]
MADAGLEAFLGRVMEHLPGLSSDRFSSQSWRFENRPTNEGLGLKPRVELDVDKVAARILDVEAYSANIKFVESCEMTNKISDSEQVYTQRMKLPALGGIQVSLHMVDLGERDGYRVVGWSQDDAGTEALNPKQGGARTQYNLGAWLITPTSLAYALSAAPVKKDVGGLKFAIMTKGSDA